MNSQTVSVGSSINSSASSDSSNSNSSSQSDSRLTVADILSSMANGETVPPSTFATLDGFSTGIPTRTTPTLTPTTLRSIEQTFIELQSVPPQTNHHNQAGFVPPVVNTTNASSHVTATSSYQNMSSKVESLWYSTPSPSPSPRSTSSGRGHTTKASGRMGGRRPNRDEKLSPEEEERRRIRRERNKIAAARCRKRRLDHTNLLLTETDGLEETKLGLQKEIGDLQTQKEHLEFLLEAHRCNCKNNNKLNGINNNNNNNNHHLKDVIAVSVGSVATSSSSHVITSSAYSDSKPPTRPTSLHLAANFTVPSSTSLRLNTSVSVSDVTGIPISTPSSGMFNFDSLLEGGTGLTPISSGLTPIVPTCSSQQRSSNCDMVSPENMNPPKLVSL